MRIEYCSRYYRRSLREFYFLRHYKFLEFDLDEDRYPLFRIDDRSENKVLCLGESDIWNLCSIDQSISQLILI